MRFDHFGPSICSRTAGDDTDHRPRRSVEDSVFGCTTHVTGVEAVLDELIEIEEEWSQFHRQTSIEHCRLHT
jgi:hypothetical protein